MKTHEARAIAGALSPNPNQDFNESFRARAAIQAVVELAGVKFSEPLTLAQLAAAAGVRVTTLTRWFNHRFDMPPMQWLWTFRAALAAQVISHTERKSFGEIASYCGFTSQAHFTRKFRQVFRMTPSQYRREAMREAPDEALPPLKVETPPKVETKESL